MSLAKYKQKRSADKTPEPCGGTSTGKELRFVIQKHAASHLHYDFRLEMDGVLKSWAVPKGPSTDPEIKRLAMMVEDHPYDYRDFEGLIPTGQYGGGTVIVWDEGSYEPAEPVSSSYDQQEKQLLHGLYSGKLKFILHGKKLKGTFALVKAKGRGENGWLLMKLEDKYASSSDITLKDKSVISKKTIDQMAQSPERVYGKDIVETGNTVQDKKAGRPATAKKINKPSKTSATKKAAVKKTALKRSAATIAAKGLLKGTPKTAFYDTVAEPMLATLVDKPFDQPGWVYEIKWDGYRAVAFMNKRNLEIKSRNNKSFNEKFYPIYDALKALQLNAIIDGEVVVVSDNGQANFGALQNWRSEADGSLIYYVFDILWHNGHDLTGLPLLERKNILEQLIPENDIIRISRHFETSGIEFLEAAKQMDLEGVMAKRIDSTYQIGNRTRDWLKIKASKRQEVVIGGYTRNVDSGKPFSSLLVGVFEKGRLVYTGKIGTGFNTATQKDLLAQFQPLVIGKAPFTEEPDINKPSRFRPNPPKATATWLKPRLVCEVSYTELTSDGVMRHPSFEGMRSDKKARSVVLETEAASTDVIGKGSAKAKAGSISFAKPIKGQRKTLLNPAEETQVKKIGGHELKFTNLSKIFWPDIKATKRDMLNYYYQVAPMMLPYLKDRPMSLNRYPNGITGKSFYQKDMTGKVPGWIETYLYHSSADNRDRNYLICKKEADLLYMANLGSIEMNPWNSREQSEEHPDWCVIDLDPDKNSFDQVIECARVTHQLLESIGVPSYCKTSGSTGLHIYIPLGAKYDYEASKEFGRAIATIVHRELPKFTSIERLTARRGGKMYIDFLQNRPQATLAAPYSVRPKPGATVSMPLYWEEVKKGLKMSDFHIYNAMDRLKETGDLFRPVIGKGISLQKALKELDKL
jgi:bifunctional non-homologous end joining protein LigD